LKVLIIPDSFKESLTQEEVSNTIKEALENLDLDLEIKTIPISDGGEGFVLSLSKILKLRILSGTSFDLLKQKISIDYLSSDNTTYFESASVLALSFVDRNKRNPFNYDSYSLGRLLLEATTKNIVLGLGGTATVDGGLGLLRGLGAICKNVDGTEIKPEINNILEIDKIDLTLPLDFFKNHNVTVCYDVNNPYSGKNGSVYSFAKQKGATPKDIEILESYFVHLNNIFKRDYNMDLNNISGSGAAGGLLGVLSLLGAKTTRGIDYILEKSEMKKKIESSDIIITGEGKVDAQSFSGKVISAVNKLSKDKKVYVFAGVNEVNDLILKKYNISKIIEISDKNMPLEYNLNNAKKLLYNKVIENKKLFL